MALSLLGKRKNTSIRGGRKWSGHRGRFIYCASYARGKALVGLVWISLRLSGGGGHGGPFRAKRRSGRCSDRGSGRSGTYRPYLWGRFALLLVRRVEKGGRFGRTLVMLFAALFSSKGRPRPGFRGFCLVGEASACL